jgi:stage II sporulation protein M
MSKIRKYLFSLKAPFIESLNYIKENKEYIYSAIILFCVASILGALLHNNLGFLDKYIKQIMDSTKNLSGLNLISFIFKNNLITSFFSLFLGLIFGIPPIVNAITNGLLVGYVSEKVVSSTNILELWRLLPHGIFELPAIFISIGLGLKLGSSLFSIKRIKKLNPNLKNSINVFILIIIPLLIIAAIIEGLLITLLR